MFLTSTEEVSVSRDVHTAMAQACEKPDGSQVPAVQDQFAGEIFEHITAEYGACGSVEAVHRYYSNIGEYGLQDSMDPRVAISLLTPAIPAHPLTVVVSRRLCSSSKMRGSWLRTLPCLTPKM